MTVNEPTGEIKIRLQRLACRLTGWLSSRAIDALLRILVQGRLGHLTPDEGLRFLFRLDNFLYNLQGEVAVAYGDGVHPKHRIMRYHDFFISRVHPGERVLDIGCGIGALAFDLAEQAGAYVLGIDLAESNIAQARRQFGHTRVEYRVGDVTDDLPKEAVDVAVLSNVLEHLPSRPAFLRRVLAVGPSRLLIRVPLIEHEWRAPLKRELGVEWRLDVTHETEYTPHQFTAELAEAGLVTTHREICWGELWAEAISNPETTQRIFI
ncbi:Methyltranfer_dom domain-containing protein [Desulfovibrionales bacterium]